MSRRNGYQTSRTKLSGRRYALRGGPMHGTFEKYLHRLAERKKSSLARKRRTVFTLFHNANSLKLLWHREPNERVELVLSWQDTSKIQAIKRDLYSIDLICLIIFLSENKPVEIHEEMDGWESLVDKLPQYLPGCQAFENWFAAVAFPAFKENRTTIYERRPEARRPTNRCSIIDLD
jgi:hypothetical protein